MKKRCLALCHGHNHSNRLISAIKGDCYWYMVDIDAKNYPDYVGDVSDEYIMSYFPSGYFDVIMTLHYPIGIKDNKYKYKLVLKNISRLIKPDGVIYLSEFPKLFFWYISDDEFENLKHKMINIIGNDEYEKFMNQRMIAKKRKRWVDEELMIGNYKGLEKNKINELLDYEANEFTRHFMTLNNYTIENSVKLSFINVLHVKPM